MNIVLPICFVAVLAGLFAPRINARTYWAIAAFIILVLANYYLKH